MEETPPEADIQQLLKQWEDEFQSHGFDPQPILTKYVFSYSDVYVLMD